MKLKVTYKPYTLTGEIDLEDYGHDENVKWDDLAESEKNEIIDSLRDNNVLIVEVELVQD